MIVWQSILSSQYLNVFLAKWTFYVFKTMTWEIIWTSTNHGETERLQQAASYPEKKVSHDQKAKKVKTFDFLARCQMRCECFHIFRKLNNNYCLCA